MEKFRKDLKKIINFHSIEKICNLPDFLLAEMIVNFIESIGPIMQRTLVWHDCVRHPAQTKDTEVTTPK